jgi:hypothetical protein
LLQVASIVALAKKSRLLMRDSLKRGVLGMLVDFCACCKWTDARLLKWGFWAADVSIDEYLQVPTLELKTEYRYLSIDAFTFDS